MRDATAKELAQAILDEDVNEVMAWMQAHGISSAETVMPLIRALSLVGREMARLRGALELERSRVTPRRVEP